MAVRVCSGPPLLVPPRLCPAPVQGSRSRVPLGGIGCFCRISRQVGSVWRGAVASGGEQPLPQLLAPRRVPLQAGLRWGCRCITHTPPSEDLRAAGTQGHAGTATSLPPGKPRRGWAAWGVSGMHRFPKSRFSFFRLKQMRVSPPARSPLSLALLPGWSYQQPTRPDPAYYARVMRAQG